MIFLTSRGEITSLSIKAGRSQEARCMWQIVTGASWPNHRTSSGMAVDKNVPTLDALPLRKDAEPDAILLRLVRWRLLFCIQMTIFLSGPQMHLSLSQTIQVMV